jgi:hypothetical protein
MPRISLVVCVYKERDFLERLLNEAQGCYDDLVVVHDGLENCHNSNSSITAGGGTEPEWESPEHLSLSAPDVPPLQVSRDYATKIPEDFLPTGYRLNSENTATGSIHELVTQHGGRFYEGPRCFQQEPHWPFAWWAARNDWLLRLDADEFPSKQMRQWLFDFRSLPEPLEDISGYSCCWPLWDGKKMVSSKWPNHRFFLFNKKRVEFFAMAEQTPILQLSTIPTDLILVHAPKRKSFGLGNVLYRKQAYKWRSIIARSLFNNTDRFPRWNWKTHGWPVGWERIRLHPFKEAICRLIMMPIYETRYLWRKERKFLILASLSGGINHFLFCVEHGIRKFLKSRFQ